MKYIVGISLSSVPESVFVLLSYVAGLLLHNVTFSEFFGGYIGRDCLLEVNKMNTNTPHTKIKPIKIKCFIRKVLLILVMRCDKELI